jgi:hypothetical protein
VQGSAHIKEEIDKISNQMAELQRKGAIRQARRIAVRHPAQA